VESAETSLKRTARKQKQISQMQTLSVRKSADTARNRTL